MPILPTICPLCATGRVPQARCTACGFANHPGHQRRDHRGFARVLDPTGGAYLCTLCAMLAVSVCEHGRQRVTLLLDVPAGAVAR